MFKLFFCPQKVEKTTLKSCSEILKKISPIAAQTTQTEEFIFQNVAYRATVYRTGAIASLKCVKIPKSTACFLENCYNKLTVS